ncbi:nicotinate phosphoribosyltransferase-like isoform X4 [Gordionus sp. m RMFG-2023]|uniref:nicotinate phosphoribosyltransferase-like isoform X4 n=1 Tax=Gordionus sp. m RMFG-2023 TaxID=3053472 RepID=UPI0031FD9B70
MGIIKQPYKNSKMSADVNERDIRIITPLLTDLYQITMAYAYWKSESKDKIAVFDLYFRKNPFGGEFTIFSGLSDCIKLLENFYFEADDISYLKEILPKYVEDDFFTYLKNIDTKDIKLSAVPEGTIVFPRIPLISIEGPLPIVQLLETPLLTFVNFASLVTTNAARYRIAAGSKKRLLEFGLRRAQGPDGGLSASRYCYIGGFDGTSNVLAGKLFGIPVEGTHSHAFVSSFTHSSDFKNKKIVSFNNEKEVPDFLNLCLDWRTKVCTSIFPKIIDGQVCQTNEGELTAFAAYALSFPDHFLALVDTYDVLKSGIPNFCSVALALNDMGYRAIGIRIDSGDLSYISKQCRSEFTKVSKKFNIPWFENIKIVASNDINEGTLFSLNEQGNEIDCYGIGTHLVTCQQQPALGCVYKLVQIQGKPRMKLTQDVEKMSIPGQKNVYRLYGKDGEAILDLIQMSNENQFIEPHTKILCRHPFQAALRTYVNPTRVESLLKLYWKDGELQIPLPSIEDVRKLVKENLSTLRQDHKRHLNPTPYKVSVTDKMFNFIHKLWEENAPISELS